MLRTIVIAKTDLVRSTERIHQLSTQELDRFLLEQKTLLPPLVEHHGGRVLKGEGDSFWLVFPSVTTATLTAIELQRALRHAQVGIPDERRLKMRVSIVLGDLLERDNDYFGTAMALAARMDGVTPADEIYLAQAAWMVLNHAEVIAEYVDMFTVKGFAQPQLMYRVVQQDSIKTEHHFLMVLDLGRFTTFCRTNPPTTIAVALNEFTQIVQTTAINHQGRLRVIAGDQLIVTFDDALRTVIAAETICRMWQAFAEKNAFELPLRIGIHEGAYYLYRAHLFGETVNNGFHLVRLAATLSADLSVVVVSEQIYADLQTTDYASRWHEIPPVEIPASLSSLADLRLYRLLLEV